MIGGFELTFTNEQLVAAGRRRGELPCDTRENVAACERLVAAVRRTIGDHVYQTEDDGCGFARHAITYPDGYWIKLEIDPWVVEVTGRPQTAREYLRLAPRLEHVFAVARELCLAPHTRIGGGHVHLDRASFGGARALRNFVVDYVNHPVAVDPLNAPALASAPPSAIAAFAEGLARFDAGALDLDAWLAHTRARVYTFASPALPEGAPRTKYQALCFDRPDTIEVRAVRPQRSFAEFVRQLAAFEARIAHLATRDAIPLAL